MSETVNELLQNLQKAGSHDSSGTFSLDLERMALVLQHYQLKTPDEFILRALAAAVASGATWFRHEQNRGFLRLSWDGQPYIQEDLQTLWSSLTQTPPQARLQELAIALNTARDVGDVSFQSPAGALQMRGPRVAFDPNRQSEFSLLELRYPRGWKPWLRRLRSPSTKKLLHQRANLAPLEFRPDVGSFLFLDGVDIWQPSICC